MVLEVEEETAHWTVARASELYQVEDWGKGYFSINGLGHVCVHPYKEKDRSIDLKILVDRLQLRGINPPILLRFGDILKHRLSEIYAAFQQAIKEHGYQGGYHCIYPIKVNQQRQVIEEVLRFGRPYGFGLEAGSKAELLAVIALADNQTPIICNGFKDEEFIEMAVLAHQIGRRIIPVIEKYTELEMLLHHAERIGVRPVVGMRVKLASRGSGRWQGSAGYRSKFGLTVTELLRALEELKARQMGDCFQLLHFHLGSQITNIQYIKRALDEAARIYVDLLRLGAGLKYLDVGGGLGVDYDGSQTNFESSVNYTLQEYANDVVYHIMNVCQDAEVPHPTILSESGRAIAAYHSVLVFNVLGVSGPDENQLPLELPEDADQPLITLRDTYQELHLHNLVESFHDAQQALDMLLALFSSGYLSLEHRAIGEKLYWAICRKIQRLMKDLQYVPEDLQMIETLLSHTYFCNFSLFQSMPDSWAIKQLFPIMPIHRLNERPTHQAILADITCDSDGKIDRFIDRRAIKRALPLHPFDGRPYYLGAFLVGAYQEILGDLHNLFGDTNAVHIGMDEQGEAVVETVINGDTVREVLQYVQFDPKILVDQLQTSVEQAVREGRINDEQAGRFLRFYEASLEGYTYLEEAHRR